MRLSDDWLASFEDAHVNARPLIANLKRTRGLLNLLAASLTTEPIGWDKDDTILNELKNHESTWHRRVTERLEGVLKAVADYTKGT